MLAVKAEPALSLIWALLGEDWIPCFIPSLLQISEHNTFWCSAD